jgi:hypothetical protein
MKFVIAAIASATILTGGAYAQTQQGGNAPLSEDRPLANPNTTTGAAPLEGRPSTTTGAAPVEGRPTGRPAVPNEPRAYGETNEGSRVNPDRVPPNSPGGQGSPNR